MSVEIKRSQITQIKMSIGFIDQCIREGLLKHYNQAVDKDCRIKIIHNSHTDTHAIIEIVDGVTEHLDTEKHVPQVTDDGMPAHGCEVCDGEDYCSCTPGGRYARCLTCGGKWPMCDPTYVEED